MGSILELDEKNMYAVIEPLTTLAQLHAEANKRGLYIGSPEASAQSSALAGHLFQGMWGVGYRLRRCLPQYPGHGMGAAQR